MAIVFVSTNPTSAVSDGFEVIPTVDVELTVAESPRCSDDHDPRRRGSRSRRHRGQGRGTRQPIPIRLERDVDFVKYTMTRKRLLAGLGSAGVRQLQFVMAEEGITAAAYVVISSVGGSWTIEECGDRTPPVRAWGPSSRR